jgi:hypothetical protein
LVLRSGGIMILGIACNDKKVVGVFVRFRAPLHRN